MRSMQHQLMLSGVLHAIAWQSMLMGVRMHVGML
jgi:hypothetical protein